MYMFNYNTCTVYMQIIPMSISLTALRQQLFNIVDQVIETGIPVEINRKGYTVKIVLDDQKSKLANLSPHDCIMGDPDELIDLPVHQWNRGDEL